MLTNPCFLSIKSMSRTIQQNFQFPSLNQSQKIVLNSLRKYVNKILNNLWPVLTLSPFSPIYHWRKLLKFVVTHFIRIKNCSITSVKISLRNILELNLATAIFCLIVSFINKLMVQPWISLWALAQLMLSQHIMNKFGSVFVRISLSLCIIKDMWTIYLFDFVLLTILKNLMNI